MLKSVFIVSFTRFLSASLSETTVKTNEDAPMLSAT